MDSEAFKVAVTVLMSALYILLASLAVGISGGIGGGGLALVSFIIIAASFVALMKVVWEKDE